ncbi:MAG: hypothetical protein Q9164_000946 [Protoblastenia rupestris]
MFSLAFDNRPPWCLQSLQVLRTKKRCSMLNHTSWLITPITPADHLPHLPFFDTDKCIQGIESGIHHLHSLGYVHNDIGGPSIMLMEDDVPVIMDFDSCVKEGEKSLEGPKYNWYDDSYDTTVARKRNDYSGLKKVREWLEDLVEFGWD